MMPTTTIINIAVQALSVDGQRVCLHNDWRCRFLGVRRFGSIDVCMIDGQDVEPIGANLEKPAIQCPLGSTEHERTNVEFSGSTPLYGGESAGK